MPKSMLKESKPFRDVVIWVDLETTGLNPGVHAITQIAAVPTYLGPDFAPFTDDVYFHQTILPGLDAPNSAKALAVQGKTIEDLERDGRHPHLVAMDFLDFVSTVAGGAGGGPIFFAGQNAAAFDVEFLKKFLISFRFGPDHESILNRLRLRRGQVLDTMHMSRYYHALAGSGWGRTGLESMTEHLGLPKYEAHNPLADVRATIAVARELTANISTILSSWRKTNV